jgi:hypothetical protein
MAHHVTDDDGDSASGIVCDINEVASDAEASLAGTIAGVDFQACRVNVESRHQTRLQARVKAGRLLLRCSTLGLNAAETARDDPGGDCYGGPDRSRAQGRDHRGRRAEVGDEGEECRAANSGHYPADDRAGENGRPHGDEHCQRPRYAEDLVVARDAPNGVQGSHLEERCRK